MMTVVPAWYHALPLRRWFAGLALLATAPVGILRAQTASAPPTSPCAQDPDRRRLDFWAGEWDVVNRAGAPAGRSSVQPIAGGCGLLESWTDLRGGTGESLNAYNPQLRRWEQFWVGQFGAVTEYRDSEWRGDTLVYLAESRNPAGQPIRLRLSFNPMPDGSVRQFGEMSADGGRTWTTTYEFFYRRSGRGEVRK